MSPKARLIASAASSLIAILLLESGLTAWVYPALIRCSCLRLLAFYLQFLQRRRSNAFNLIDGFNGLSSYITVSVALSLSIIAFQSGNTQISIFLVLMAAAVLGFMALNFPMGKIFLGDGGAYALGHLLVWSAIILISGVTDISAFAILLVFFCRWRIRVWLSGADGSWVIQPTAPTAFTSPVGYAFS